MPKLAAFPKAFIQALCKDGTMTLAQWVDLAAPLGLDGLEYYSGFLELADAAHWSKARHVALTQHLYQFFLQISGTD